MRSVVFKFNCTDNGIYPSTYFEEKGLILTPGFVINTMWVFEIEPILEFTSDGSVKGIEMANKLKREFKDYVTEEKHDWAKYRDDTYESCKKCGIIKRSDGKNKPCKGKVKVKLRDINYSSITGD